MSFKLTIMSFLNLGGISTKHFLKEYWQKKPLLVRNAFADFNGFINPKELFQLVIRDDVESRLVARARSKWSLEYGPFSQKKLDLLPNKNWTVLVQDLNHYLAEATKFLRNFSFIPHVRLDDLMVSYAAPGGGVGPHFDSYDVFLIQGIGKRRWRISSQDELDLVPDLSLKILDTFVAEEEWTLEAGDMLYLPPKYAHEGVALTECMTYSVGFRAPSSEELMEAFLTHLQDNISTTGLYEDPDLVLTTSPGEIPALMINKVNKVLNEIKWDSKEVAHFLGAYMSEPKPHVYFDGVRSPLSLKKFSSTVLKKGVRLSLKSRMLYQKGNYYLNGEFFKAPSKSHQFLRSLADQRFAVPASDMEEETWKQLRDWYSAGYLEL